MEQGDLDALRERGRLRILVPPPEVERLPRQGDPLGADRELARELARALGLEPEFVTIAERDALQQALLQGRGDVVLARLTITPERRRRFAFSTPLGFAREMLVVGAEDTSVHRPADLAGRRVAVRASSSYHATLVALRESVPGLEIMTVPEWLSTETILARVAQGEYDASVADEDLVRSVLAYRDDLRVAFALSELRPVAWALRPGARQLKAAVDRFLHEQSLTGDLGEVLRGDLDAIRRRRVLRVLTRNNAATTYIHRGEQVGFEYELAQAFARSVGCRLQVVIPPRFNDLVPWLLEGRGDLIAASLPITPADQARVRFTRPYLREPPLVVVRSEGEALDGPAALAGRRVAVRAASTQERDLALLRQARSIDMTVESVEDAEPAALLAGVAERRYDAAVVPGHLYRLEAAGRDDLRAAFELGQPIEVAWAVRPQDTALRAEADRFLDENGPGSAFFNVLHRRYLADPQRLRPRLAERPEVSGRLSPWDDVFRQVGHEEDLDWRLLAAVAYQESRFDSQAESLAGAVGLMQMLPATAARVGVRDDLRQPEVAIRAGARYLRRLSQGFYASLELAERLRFALAAYNAGVGHVADGRELARERGLDPDVWFGNVERVLPLLANEAVASRAPAGYCRCGQTVRFVRDVHERYQRYALVAE